MLTKCFLYKFIVNVFILSRKVKFWYSESVVMKTERLDMTITVDWDVKKQIKPKTQNQRYSEMHLSTQTNVFSGALSYYELKKAVVM